MNYQEARRLTFNDIRMNIKQAVGYGILVDGDVIFFLYHSTPAHLVEVIRSSPICEQICPWGSLAPNTILMVLERCGQPFGRILRYYFRSSENTDMFYCF